MSPQSPPLTAALVIRLFRTPLILIAVTLLGMAWAQFQPELDNNLRLWALWILPFVCSIVLLVWFLYYGPVTRNAKNNVFIGISILAALAGGLLRVEGSTSGTGLPNFIWRWSARQKLPATPNNQAPTKNPSSSALLDSPQFLGSDRNGILPPATFSSDWKTHSPNQLWRQSIGEGWSAFCVVGGRAITQEQREAEEWVCCYDLGTGALLWHHADVAHFSEWQSGDGPRATPTHEAGKLYTLGATGILNCLDLSTGKLLWKQEVLAQGKQNLEWGLSCSPLIYNDSVIVTASEAPTMLAFNKTTGSPL
jgi:outer membrane protein assembly factor BamB